MDIFLLKRKNILLASLITAACCCLMVAFPTIALYSARKGISLWLSNVLPALLPFFICANFLQNIGAIRFLKSGVFPFAMSVLSGYPMGAKIVGDLRRSGEISLNETKRLMSFCSTSGPAFMVGAVGAGMLGSGLLGAIIAISHYAGALINGILYTKLLWGSGDMERKGRASSKGSNKNTGNPGSQGAASSKQNEGASWEQRSLRVSLQESFTDAIFSSFKSLGIVLAYIVLFMFVTDMLHMCGGFSFMDSQMMRVLLKGFFEMTVGCGAVAECVTMSAGAKCMLCSLILSWGGLSVIGQSMSMLAGTGISLKYLLVSKLTHSFFSLAIAFIIVTVVL